MKTLVLVAVAALCGGAAARPGFAPLRRSSGTGVNGMRMVPNRYLVKLDPTANLQQARSRVNSFARGLKGKTADESADMEPIELPHINMVALTLNETQLERIRWNPNVLEVTEIVELAQSTDPRNNWGLDRINQQRLPLDGNRQLDKTGRGVDIYILDSGVEITHPQFEGRASFFWTGTGSNVDGNGHGTHCAGVAASKSYGVAKKANIKAVKIIKNDGTGDMDVVLQGMQYVIDKRDRSRPAVASLSINVNEPWAPLSAMARAMVNSGISVVAAAGNNNNDACRTAPASEPSLITVGNAYKDDTKAYNSNWGKCVDVFAPGSGIWSTFINSSTKNLSGTSMAAPHVSGVAALILQSYPKATPQQVQQAIINISTKGTMTNLGGAYSETPNRLLYGLTNDVQLPPNNNQH